MNKSLDEIAKLVSGKVVGDGSIRVTGLSGIKEASGEDLTFLSSPRFLPYLETTSAAAVLVPPTCKKAQKTLILVEDPYLAFTKMLENYESENRKHPHGIHPTAVIGENVVLGDNVALDAHVRIADNCQIGAGAVIYAGAYIGANSTIGPGTVVYPNAVLRESTIVGSNCLIHSNASIGSDGFGFVNDDGQKSKIPQIGTVLLDDDVEIGSNTSIDRATCGQTFIGKGTKIDNQCQIGHNVRIGSHCTISGGTLVAGSATIGNNVTIGGDASIGGHLEIGDNVIIAGRTGVTKSIAAGRIVSGFPPYDHVVNKRIMVSQRRLPDALKKLKELEKRLAELEGQRNGKTANNI